MSPHDYAKLLCEILERKTETLQKKILVRFKIILAKNKHAHLAHAIQKELAKIQEQRKREKITYISSASELTASQKKELEGMFSAPHEFSVNPSLHGGVAVRQNDIVFNGTLRKKLEILKFKN